MAERGDVLRVRGDLTGAQAAYERAVAFGHEPQPGLALLWLAQGRTEVAAAAIRRLLGETGDPVHRSRLLPAAVEVLLAAGQHDQGAATAAELESIAGSFGCPSLQARADYAAALVALESGDPAAAMPLLRQARAVWERLGGPYETARCRVQLGRALHALGDEQSAVTELAAARRTFAELGTAPAEQEAATLITPTYPSGLTAREVEVLRLVAVGKSNPEIAGQLFLSEKTVARHLSNIFTKIDVTSRTAAAAFAYEHHIA
jgi:ATP/maltotriose-dependent transcriptional regulator MalT